MKPTLFILAAGLGSRYGGLKQMDSVGPSGETIMEYSVYDAINAGFGKIVFVIRNSFDKEFKEYINRTVGDRIDIELVYQELDTLPEGFKLNPKREKPWGTNHAVLMAKGVIKEPFCVINADDFYGTESFQIMANFHKKNQGAKGKYAMVGYQIENTLSESGSVARGICQVSAEGQLTSVVENTHIERKDGKIQSKKDTGWEVIPEGTPVSMNFFAFTPEYLEYSETAFIKFLKENENEPKKEFFIPSLVSELINTKKATVEVLLTTSQWFGVTYKEDKDTVIQKIKELVSAGVYPSNLWK